MLSLTLHCIHSEDPQNTAFIFEEYSSSLESLWGGTTGKVHRCRNASVDSTRLSDLMMASIALNFLASKVLLLGSLSPHASLL